MWRGIFFLFATPWPLTGTQLGSSAQLLGYMRNIQLYSTHLSKSNSVVIKDVIAEAKAKVYEWMKFIDRVNDNVMYRQV